MTPKKRATRKTAARGRKRAQGASADSTGVGAGRTIVYVHGIANKPPESVLCCQWDRALFGYPLGERSRMAYWCQEDRNGPPLDDTCAGSDRLDIARASVAGYGARSLEREGSIAETVEAIGRNEAERASLARLAGQMRPNAARARLRAKKMEAEGLGDWNVPDILTRFVTGLFLKDVRDFFFDDKRRARMQRAFMDRLEVGGGPFVVIAHSQGTMIAYSVLQKLDPARYQVPLLITMGSPLGLAEVRQQIRRINGIPGKGKLPVPACIGDWANFLDPADPVAQGEELLPFYTGGARLRDFLRVNSGRPRDPHSATGYLGLMEVRQEVRRSVDIERFQPMSRFVLAPDAVRAYEGSASGERQPVLIEITDAVWARERRDSKARESGKAPPALVQEEFTTEKLAASIERMILDHADEGTPAEAFEVVKLKRYVSARLTRREAERLSNVRLDIPPFYRIWRNAKKRAMLETSIHTLQAAPAHRSYEAFGQNIQWAVLDSGCTPHPHFEALHTIANRWDCTLPSQEPLAHGEKFRSARANTHDGYGHGTHVSGIIAGRFERLPTREGAPTRVISGIAPRAKLHVYKVLNDEGEGEDAWIIKALDHIASVNEHAGRMVIAGVNLSLGGPFEREVFGCGHTPLCDELRRLWHQGVVVVLSAGNEGFANLLSDDGEVAAQLAMSLSDPANLEEAIVVGSTHKERPHTYGVSFFSSRGPTADGRKKPDCVAPGEQILSCHHRPKTGSPMVRDLYYKLDGTSMAAPHVSGLIAAYLSRKTEFIGYPDRVKEILLGNCTDLGRERSMQGAGMPNLVRMLVQT